MNPEAPLLRPKNAELCAGIAGMNRRIWIIIKRPLKGWVVSRCRWFLLSNLAVIGLSLAALAFPAAGQGLRTVVESRDKVFPGVGAGVTALKRDSSGRYYILAKPETIVSVFGPDGNLIGQIPNAKSNGATIRYAVDIDLSPDGLLVVADRGANAIDVFSPDGSLVSRTPVVAPTSVVALSDGQFAVTSLTSKRLVEVIDQRGKVVRNFGDPIEVDDQPDKQAGDKPPDKEPLISRGKVSGDSVGGIYFAFTSVPDPTVRKYDRYGYVGYEASIPEHVFGETPTRPNDRVEFTFGLSDESFSQQTRGSITLGSSGDLKFNGGVGTGFGEALRRGEGFNQAVEQQTMGGGGGPFGAMFSGQVSSQGTNIQLGMGRMSGFGGRGRGRMGFGSVSDQTTSQGAALQFNSSNSDFGTSSSDLSQSSSSVDASSMTAELQSGFGSNGTGATDQSGAVGDTTGGAFNQGGLTGAFVLGSFDPFGFGPGPRGGPGDLGGHAGGPRSGTTGLGSLPSAGAGTGARGPGGFSHYGYRGRFGSNSLAFTGGMRVNLGDLGRVSSFDKPIITAMAADPETHEIWAGIGDTLVHFSRDGDPVGIYYLTLTGGTALKPVAVLVESDRLLIAADPWGIFEFARPDKLSAPKQQLNIVPQVVPQPR